MIWQYMEKGMACAAWVAGFLAVIGMFFLVIGITGYLLTYVFSDGEEDDEDGEDSK